MATAYNESRWGVYVSIRLGDKKEKNGKNEKHANSVNDNEQSKKVSWWINELDSLGIEKSSSNNNKSESKDSQELEDLTYDINKASFMIIKSAIVIILYKGSQSERQDEHRGFNKYKLNYAYVNRAGMYKHWKCEKCDNLFGTSKELIQHKQEYHAY